MVGSQLQRAMRTLESEETPDVLASTNVHHTNMKYSFNSKGRPFCPQSASFMCTFRIPILGRHTRLSGNFGHSRGVDGIQGDPENFLLRSQSVAFPNNFLKVSTTDEQKSLVFISFKSLRNRWDNIDKCSNHQSSSSSSAKACGARWPCQSLLSSGSVSKLMSSEVLGLCVFKPFDAVQFTLYRQFSKQQPLR